MLGLRGVRLGIVIPGLFAMQARAILEAAAARITAGGHPHPEIMIPLVATVQELELVRADIHEVADDIESDTGVRPQYAIGTMIELPRAALTADEIATQADFFSFGTNDLTQTTLGLSRDDAGRFLPMYVESGIFPDDPFRVLDTVGVGKLVKYAVTEGRKVRPNMKTGICGEHGGEPRSIAFCQSAGLNYVSCSPYRVPIARLAAAQASLRLTK